MLVTLALPIILSAVALFFASFLSWMVLPFHRQDWIKVAKEDQLLQALRVGFPSAGVLHHEASTGPQRVVRHPVAGNPGQVLDHRFTTPQDPVHQRRFADVRPAHHGHHRYTVALPTLASPAMPSIDKSL